MKILKLPAVEEKTGKGHTSIYEEMKSGTFPKSIPTGKRSVGWVEEEIDNWIQSRIAARDASSR